MMLDQFLNSRSFSINSSQICEKEPLVSLDKTHCQANVKLFCNNHWCNQQEMESLLEFDMVNEILKGKTAVMIVALYQDSEVEVQMWRLAHEELLDFSSKAQTEHGFGKVCQTSDLFSVTASASASIDDTDIVQDKCRITQNYLSVDHSQ